MNDQEKGYAEQRARMRNEEFVQGTNERNREYIPPTKYSTAQPAQQRSTNTNYNSNNKKNINSRQQTVKKPANHQKNAQYFLMTAAFIAGAYYFFIEFYDNLIGAAIAGTVSGFIAYKWFKAIIVIAVIIGVIYFIKNDI